MKNLNSIIIKHPSRCTENELCAFTNNVIQGGQVTPFGLEARIKRAELLAFSFSKDVVIGIAALKRPFAGYREDVYNKAGVKKHHQRYPIELGWVYTKPEFQGKGIASELVSRLLNENRSKNVFATTQTTKIGMQKILEKNGFKKFGHSFKSQSNDYALDLFVLDVNRTE